ncbi:MAG: hypothetical protein ACLGGV_04250, partial [Bacteroidia bacterium]
VAAFSQSDKTKASLKKIKYDVSELAYTDEKLKIYPRGFIYKVNEPDSVFYFACFSSDQEDVSNYFEGKETSLSKFALNSQLYRGIEGYMDTMIMESLDIKLSHFKSSTGEKYSINEDTKYVLMYYWRNDMMFRLYVKNFRYFKKYAREHPELNIQVIAVSTDNVGS